MNGVIFSPSENYLTRINGWASDDDPRSLKPILATHLGLDPFSQIDTFQSRPLSAKDEEDDEDWDDDEDEDWDDEDDEDWDDDEEEEEEEEGDEDWD